MIEISKRKQSESNVKNFSFLQHDVTSSRIDDLFDGNDSVKITLCMYNTVGVIDGTLSEKFFDDLIRLAGSDGI